MEELLQSGGVKCDDHSSLGDAQVTMPPACVPSLVDDEANAHDSGASKRPDVEGGSAGAAKRRRVEVQDTVTMEGRFSPPFHVLGLSDQELRAINVATRSVPQSDPVEISVLKPLMRNHTPFQPAGLLLPALLRCPSYDPVGKTIVSVNSLHAALGIYFPDTVTHIIDNFEPVKKTLDQYLHTDGVGLEAALRAIKELGKERLPTECSSILSRVRLMCLWHKSKKKKGEGSQAFRDLLHHQSGSYIVKFGKSTLRASELKDMCTDQKTRHYVAVLCSHRLIICSHRGVVPFCGPTAARDWDGVSNVEEVHDEVLTLFSDRPVVEVLQLSVANTPSKPGGQPSLSPSNPETKKRRRRGSRGGKKGKDAPPPPAPEPQQGFSS